MKIVFVSNFINHYQVPVSEELYKLTSGNYYFIETQELPDSFKKGGFANFDKPYIVRAWENRSLRKRALDLALEADVLVASGDRMALPYERKRLNAGKLTFEYAERPLKRGWINLFSPTNFLLQLNYHLFFYNKPFYKLCVSAFTANDMYLQHAFIDRCYKYGYFPPIPECDPQPIIQSRSKDKLRIIWVARFIPWKHPEMAVQLARKLEDVGYNFEINMIGSGVMYDEISKMIVSEGLTNKVHLLGNFPNAEVLNIMKKHDVFLFTSDQNEGWGVVLNEAMGQACCPIASNKIGSVPFLLKDKFNGLIFENNNVDSLFEKVKYLIESPDLMHSMSLEAYKTVSELWSSQNAAKRLYSLFEAKLRNESLHFKDGPLSVALPIAI